MEKNHYDLRLSKTGHVQALHGNFFEECWNLSMRKYEENFPENEYEEFETSKAIYRFEKRYEKDRRIIAFLNKAKVLHDKN